MTLTDQANSEGKSENGKLENSPNATLFVRANANPFVSLASPSTAEQRPSQYQNPMGDCQFFATARVEIE